MDSLIRAAFQIETSAARHCEREAKRFGRAPPTEALLAIAAHAEGSRDALLSACAQDGLQTSVGDRTAGLLFREVGDWLGDLALHGEHAYRATLLGLGHGLELMRKTSVSARAASKLHLADFCSSWLATRTTLMQRAESLLSWFIVNVEKGVDQRWLGERYGRIEQGPALHPLTKETGLKGLSNVGVDETSGSD